MRNIQLLNDGWSFSKSNLLENPQPADLEAVTLPHTWNAVDGQDGGNDYYRGTCYYRKEMDRADLPEGQKVYLEFRGTNSSATLYANGKKVAEHDGGYSTWRANITDFLEDHNVFVVAVDNAPNNRVYPQTADFTFYGGIYRNVYAIGVHHAHFDLDYYGAPGIQVTPVIKGADAEVELKAYITAPKDGRKVVFTVSDAEGNTVATAETTTENYVATAKIGIPQVHLWNGRKDPYLYTASADLVCTTHGVIDTVSTRFGCRTFEITKNDGFYLNGQPYPLHGVSRHQDRKGIGNALLPEHHREDMELIKEVGATTIRLAHYQHDQYFYDLCDENGLVIWAEIPYISKHMDTGYDNTISQMTELVAQNYNHPSIVVWGLSNEITMGTASDFLIQNHKDLNDLCHKMDPTRKTTMAVLTMTAKDHPLLKIPDVLSWNHYFGWYGGTTDMNGPFFDDYHKQYPDIPVGISEYGCEALNWHTSKPTQGDYTEEYQAYYHEELIKQLFTRKYIWASHVWNMFDFGADARAEGGENGQNHKGLVTFDRTYKKDSFYAYKAWLSDEPFVHLCGKRYIDRTEAVTKVTVYSNQPTVELFANGKSLGAKTEPQHFFYFEVPNEGETTLKAVAGDCVDESRIRKVAEPNPDYILHEQGAVLNWFDITEKEGYYSLNDTLADLSKNPAAMALVFNLFAKKGIHLVKDKKAAGKDTPAADTTASAGSTASADTSTGKAPKGNPLKKLSGMKTLAKGAWSMMGGFTVVRATRMAAMADISFTKKELLTLNKRLNRLKKKSK